MSTDANEQLILRNDVRVYFISVIYKESVRKPVNLKVFDWQLEVAHNSSPNGLIVYMSTAGGRDREGHIWYYAASLVKGDQWAGYLRLWPNTRSRGDSDARL